MDATATEALVAAVMQHAEKNYERDGWDYVAECYSDEEIADVIKTARTPAGALKMMRAHVKHRAEYRDEICAEIF
jgi:hypothetical protein